MPIDHLPVRLRSPARRLRDWLLTDAPAMVIIGAGVLIRGISYSVLLGSPPATGSHPAELALPMHLWAIIWITVGAGLLLASARHTGIIAAVMLGLGISLNAIWGFSFLASTFVDSPRAYVTAVGYLSLVGLVAWAVWRGRTGQVRRGA